MAHGLIAYSSQQSSLNALFIADYVFAIVCRALRSTETSEAGDAPPEESADAENRVAKSLQETYEPEARASHQRIRSRS